ncbi:hypothetical protein N7524_003958 [Penicillium chrysogenum]|nr:hypothetical protein N7524_003958 [Penicillium chrysogenum]
MCDTRRDSSDICLVYIPLQSDLGLDRGTSRLVAETTHDPGVRWRPAFPTGSRIVEPVEGSTDGRVAVGDGWCFRSSWRLNADQMGAKRQAQKRPKQHWLGVLVPRLRLLRHTAHHGQDRVWGINTLDRRAAKCRYQHAEPSLATPLDALTQQPRPLTHETLQRYSSLHCALVLGYNRVSPESCKQAPGPPLVCPGLPV